MSMFATVLANLFAAGRTRAPDDQPPVPPALRGHLAHDPSLCTGCGTCAHVCAPKAIVMTGTADRDLAWTWFSGACSYCGLCRIWCPTRAIDLLDEVPDTAERGGEMRLADPVVRHACSRCGRPHTPLAVEIQAEMLGGPLAGTALDEKDLCEDCRRRMSSERIRDAFMGPTPKPAPRSFARTVATEKVTS